MRDQDTNQLIIDWIEPAIEQHRQPTVSAWFDMCGQDHFLSTAGGVAEQQATRSRSRWKQ